MTKIGYTMMCEQAGPKELVRDVVLAEEAGFDFAVISDHYFRGWTPKGTPPTPGACSAPLRRRPTTFRS
jgi:alkanesulfonate monooxygenase SsuD/methylene tetrahydromethanopterin reductase-like flavin-dependent oxidoreductase (luciferase family)